MNSLAKMFTRVTAVMLKELRELARRPGAIASLMLGPLIVVALFGLGYSGQARPLETVVVVPTGATLPQDAETYRKLGGAAIRVVAVTQDTNSAHVLLGRGEAGIDVGLPVGCVGWVEDGEQGPLIVE